jgi:hypothetical protein
MLFSFPRLSVLIFSLSYFVSFPASALLFSWTPGNPDIIVNPDSLELTVDGLTVTAQAFTAEINTAGDDAVVLGPWPTQTGANAAGLGVDVRGLGSEQLGLIADPSILADANGSDFFSGGLSPGFSSGYGNDTVVNPAVPAFHFALFTFSQPVDIPGVTVDDVTNQDRDIWMGTGITAPDFTGGFLSGIASFDIFNSPDDPASDGLYTHSLPSVATGISYFLVGAPPQGANLGPINGTGSFSGSNFFIDSFDGTPSETGPAPVPEPATIILLAAGLLGMGTLRHKKFM